MPEVVQNDFCYDALIHHYSMEQRIFEDSKELGNETWVFDYPGRFPSSGYPDVNPTNLSFREVRESVGREPSDKDSKLVLTGQIVLFRKPVFSGELYSRYAQSNFGPPVSMDLANALRLRSGVSLEKVVEALKKPKAALHAWAVERRANYGRNVYVPTDIRSLHHVHNSPRITFDNPERTVKVIGFSNPAYLWGDTFATPYVITTRPNLIERTKLSLKLLAKGALPELPCGSIKKVESFSRVKMDDIIIGRNLPLDLRRVHRVIMDEFQRLAMEVKEQPLIILSPDKREEGHFRRKLVYGGKDYELVRS